MRSAPRSNSMCEEEREVRVDYATSDSELALDVLQCCDARCVCIPLLVSRCLNLAEDEQTPELPRESLSLGIEAKISYLRTYPPPSLYRSATGRGRKWWKWSQPTFTIDGRYYEVHDVKHAEIDGECTVEAPSTAFPRAKTYRGNQSCPVP